MKAKTHFIILMVQYFSFHVSFTFFLALFSCFPHDLVFASITSKDYTSKGKWTKGAFISIIQAEMICT